MKRGLDCRCFLLEWRTREVLQKLGSYVLHMCHSLDTSLLLGECYTLETSLDTVEHCFHKVLVGILESFLAHFEVQTCCTVLEAFDKNLVGRSSLGSLVVSLPSLPQPCKHTPPFDGQESHNKSKAVKRQHY